MIRIKNDGIREAIDELRTMSLSKTVRYLYEERLKARRDRWAEDQYVRNEGRAEGKAEDILLLLKEYGDVPPELSEKIMAERNPELLNQWLKIAARADSIEQFKAQLPLESDRILTNENEE
ncbi:MAG: hypothetical protein NC432_07060 [Roseburia sp.]|nr:hypothetical protein [Roseburia sp.]MCM1098179.1 hypothetical protein [Ruminococcus flavefaciens]MCM1232091.1 hypothetical protein [Ruminococcus flavefaciens]